MAVVAAAAAHGLPFVCVPAGTCNHFARDLGVDPHDVIGAPRCVHGRVRASDRRGRSEWPGVSQQRLARDLRRRGPQPRLSRCQGAHTWRPPRRCSAQAQRCQRCGWLTTWDASTVILPSCSCRTTPTRWIARSPEGGRLARQRPARDHCSRCTGRGPPPPSRACVERATSGGGAPAPVHAGVDGEAVDLSPPLQFTIRSGASASPDLIPPSSHLTIGAVPTTREPRRPLKH